MNREQPESTPKSDDIYKSCKGTNHGYIVEWRCVENVKIMGRFDQDFPRKEWRQAPYDIKKMRLDGAAGAIVRPVISHWDDLGVNTLGGHGLVNLLVAEAIIACTKTFVEAHPELTELAGYIEFRARPCKLTFDWKVTKDDMDDNTTAPNPDGQ